MEDGGKDGGIGRYKTIQIITELRVFTEKNALQTYIIESTNCVQRLPLKCPPLSCMWLVVVEVGETRGGREGNRWVEGSRGGEREVGRATEERWREWKEKEEVMKESGMKEERMQGSGL